MLALHLLQMAMVYINTLMIQQILTDDVWWEGMTPDDFRALMPLIYTHMTPYGTFRLDMNERLPLEAASNHRTCRRIQGDSSCFRYFAVGDSLVLTGPTYHTLSGSCSWNPTIRGHYSGQRALQAPRTRPCRHGYKGPRSLRSLPRQSFFQAWEK
jgi:Tn3 transposase DDE domain